MPVLPPRFHSLAQILALSDPALAERVRDWRAQQTAAIADAPQDDA